MSFAEGAASDTCIGGESHVSRINEIVGAFLLKKEHTKEQLADAAGISVPALNDRLNGESLWKWDEVCRISDFLDRPISDFR